MLHAHSGLRYIVLGLLILIIVQSYRAWRRKKSVSAGFKQLLNFNMAVVITQLILGIGLFASSAKVLLSTEMFKSSLLRFFTLEHSLLMSIAMLTIIISSIKVKINDNHQAYKRVFWLFTIALMLIFISIPWPFRHALGAGWF